MTSEEIDRHSYAYLFEMYKEYPNRACENLGVSPDKDDSKKGKKDYKSKNSNNVTLSETDYPTQLKMGAKESKEVANLYNGIN